MSISPAYIGATNIVGSGSGPGLFSEIYYSTNAGKVAKIDEDGNTIWTFFGSNKTWIETSNQKFTYVSDDDKNIRKLDRDGNQVWINSFGSKALDRIDEGGDFVYAGIESRYYQLDKQSGSVNFSQLTQGDNSVEAIAADQSGDFYIGPDVNRIRKYNSAGFLQWEFSNMQDNSRFMEYKAGFVYSRDDTPRVKKIDASNGTQEWEFIPTNFDSLRGFAIDGEDNLYLLGKKNLWKYNSSGVQEWRVGGIDNAYDLDVTREQEVIASVNDKDIVRFDKDGNVVETIKTENDRVLAIDVL